MVRVEAFEESRLRSFLGAGSCGGFGLTGDVGESGTSGLSGESCSVGDSQRTSGIECGIASQLTLWHLLTRRKVVSSALSKCFQAVDEDPSSA